MEIKYTIKCSPEEEPVRGNALASGDDAVDKECEDEILRRLDLGDVWAWCCVEVFAEVEVDGRQFRGRDSLGCCCYKDEADFCQPGGYFDDMKSQAFDDLVAAVERARVRGKIAEALLPRLDALKPVRREVPK